jgi:ribosomal protein S20
MPIIKSAIKRAKQTIKRRARNVGIKHDIKDANKEFMANPTAKTFSAAQSEIDKAVKKGLIKKNTAARRKVNLAKFAKTAGVKFTGTKKVSAKVAAPKPAVKAVAKPAAKPAVAKTATAKPAAKKAVAKPAVKKTAAKKPAVKKAAK